MSWTVLNFGKYEGKTLPQILFTDPDWFFWALEEGVLEQHGYKAEAEKLNKQAKNIRIPDDANGEREAEYIVHPSTKNFTDVDLVPKGQKYTQGAGGTIRKKVIDLSVPRSVQNYDKMGGRLMIKAIKPVLFPGVRRLTKAIVEAFFDNKSNFAI